MLRSTLSIFSIALASLAVLAAPAPAASPSQIHQDAADGSIDGSYTLAEMRAADRSVSAEQREYFGWEDVYNAYIRSLSNPDEVPPAVPVDQNKDGKIDTNEREAAKKITRAKCTKATPAAKRSTVCAAVGVDAGEVDDTEVEPRDEDNTAATNDDEDSGTSPLLWLIVGIPILVVALGAFRMRGRGKGSPNP